MAATRGKTGDIKRFGSNAGRMKRTDIVYFVSATERNNIDGLRQSILNEVRKCTGSGIRKAEFSISRLSPITINRYVIKSLKRFFLV